VRDPASIREGLRRERAAFADSLLAAGPDAPTLCEGWRARDLAAHVVVRETRLDADVSLLLPSFGPAVRRTDQVRDGLRDATPYAELVRRVRAGSIFIALPFVERAFNLSELHVHHEDVRRGAGEADPRRIEPRMATALWRQVRRLAPWSLRGDRALRVALRTPGGREVVVHPRGQGPVASITGEPLELLLWVFGRGEAAFVGIEGNPEARRRLAAAGRRS